MTKKCAICGKRVPARHNRLYCGSVAERIGCAYEIARLHKYQHKASPQGEAYQNTYYKRWYKEHGRPDRNGRAYLAASK